MRAPPFAVDDQVVIRATRNGQTATVTNIGNPQQGGPLRRQGGPGGPRATSTGAYASAVSKPSGTDRPSPAVLAIDVASSAGADRRRGGFAERDFRTLA